MRLVGQTAHRHRYLLGPRKKREQDPRGSHSRAHGTHPGRFARPRTVSRAHARFPPVGPCPTEGGSPPELGREDDAGGRCRRSPQSRCVTRFGIPRSGRTNGGCIPDPMLPRPKRGSGRALGITAIYRLQRKAIPFLGRPNRTASQIPSARLADQEWRFPNREGTSLGVSRATVQPGRALPPAKCGDSLGRIDAKLLAGQSLCGATATVHASPARPAETDRARQALLALEASPSWGVGLKGRAEESRVPPQRWSGAEPRQGTRTRSWPR